MTQIFLVSRPRRTLLEKVWAGIMALSMMFSYGGVALVTTFLLAPAVASAVVVPQVSLLSDGFGTGNDLNDIPNWEEEGADSDSSTLAKTPIPNSDDSASPEGGRFAKIGYEEEHPSDNPGWICRIIDARGYSAATLSY